jgi:Flp pilus assembly protein TadD
MKNFKTLLLCASAIGLLGACTTTSSHTSASLKGGDRIDAALERVAEQSSHRDSLPFLETIYKRNNHDPMAALNYAQALRQTGDINRASMVLTPFAVRKDSTSAVKTEYAAIQLISGNYMSAEDYAQKAITQDKENVDALHYLGIAQDAQGYHEEAEIALRGALENWQGDPVPVLNNLALNLATQHRVDEAAEVISQAAILAPHRRNVQNNATIIQSLQRNTVPAKAPMKPARKPT